jgi:hypothetical protein
MLGDFIVGFDGLACPTWRLVAVCRWPPHPKTALGADTIYFFRTPLRAVADTLADLFRLTSADSTAKGAVSSSTVCSVAVIEVHQPFFLSFGLNFAPAAYRRTDFRRPVQGSVCMCLFVTAQIRTCCVCLATVVCCDINLARLRPRQQLMARDRKTFRTFEKDP